MARQLLKLTATLVAVFLATTARADTWIDAIGFIGADATKKFSGMRQAGMLLSHPMANVSNSFWVPSELEFSAGMLERGRDSAGYVSFGPTYRIPIGKGDRDRWFVGFGMHPTYVSESDFEGEDLGGHFFFTSFLGVGAYVDRRRAIGVMLRYLHTSNAGLDDKNPGVDMLGLTFRYRFGHTRDSSWADAARR